MCGRVSSILVAPKDTVRDTARAAIFSNEERFARYIDRNMRENEVTMTPSRHSSLLSRASRHTKKRWKWHLYC
jgi:hypothetical protein